MAKILTKEDREKLIRLAKEQGIISEDAKPLSREEHLKLVKGKKIITKCNRCDGTGKLLKQGCLVAISFECSDCDGTGKVELPIFNSKELRKFKKIMG